MVGVSSLSCIGALLILCTTECYHLMTLYIFDGIGLPSDIEYFLNCGANKVLLKPLDVEAFEQAMGEEMMKV